MLNKVDTSKLWLVVIEERVGVVGGAVSFPPITFDYLKGPWLFELLIEKAFFEVSTTKNGHFNIYVRYIWGKYEVVGYPPSYHSESWKKLLNFLITIQWAPSKLYAITLSLCTLYAPYIHLNFLQQQMAISKLISDALRENTRCRRSIHLLITLNHKNYSITYDIQSNEPIPNFLESTFVFIPYITPGHNL